MTAPRWWPRDTDETPALPPPPLPSSGPLGYVLELDDRWTLFDPPAPPDPVKELVKAIAGALGLATAGGVVVGWLLSVTVLA